MDQKYKDISKEQLHRAVEDAEFMMNSFRRGHISWKVFTRFADDYTNITLGYRNKSVKEVLSWDEHLRREAEELVNRNEKALEQMDAIRKGAGRLQHEIFINPAEAETLIQEEVARRMETGASVYFPLPAID